MSDAIDLKKHGLAKKKALDLLGQMWEIRLFEERVYDLLGKNLIKGASHLLPAKRRWRSAPSPCYVTTTG